VPSDTQKALRRSYITSALVCSRNPKLVAAELGYATSHMVVSNCDSFDRLLSLYGWNAMERLGVVAPPTGRRRSQADGRRADPRSPKRRLRGVAAPCVGNPTHSGEYRFPDSSSFVSRCPPGWEREFRRHIAASGSGPCRTP